mmetsp:Transcript_11645/g.20645  ORF Transcript_11645/g.20645 Transcript_11645/m.20645 type:complete len:636 (-) Transcript_11645:196-2103(-)|eukprot:CAMPEP_0202027614 /NCGR_PEP_ID=MMETSP0905-20130828/61896_1 /ASSEMBLY_ACC=CAM_ASM_000554 /TAXON_ID=420261 /ORGANISM="Thalassiosira antarctica, Strain CCMP982" /LENGTH=635 /DNA_ID=CAMNT_0048591173 /DNA_START=41 /DNA_END=1948 /DNA_ORIENTATION=+
MKRHATTKTSSPSRRNAAFSILCIATASSTTSVTAASASIIAASPSTRPHLHLHTHTSLIIGKIRGGGDGGDDDSSSGMQKKKRKGKSSKKSAVIKEGDATTTDDDDNDEEEGTEDAKDAINDVMKEKDAATALGDAIRDRADLLRRDRLPYSERTFDSALVSLGLSLGTAGTDKDGSEEDSSINIGTVDTLAYYQYGHRNSVHPYNYNSRRNNGQNQQDVQPSTSAVIANYFLKTHGGTHAIQCLLSLLASLLGMACLVLPAFPSSAAVAAATVAAASAKTTTTAKAAMNAKSLSRKILLSSIKYQLMQQTLLIAMAKHASALLGAVFLGASRIPQLGVRNARRHLESVALDPVGQYLFYCSLLVVWMGWFGGGSGVGGMREYIARLRGSVFSIMNASAAAAATDASNSSQDTTTVSQLLDTLSQQPPPWFLSQSTGGFILPILILGPVLLREIISILWVCSDVLTLAVTTSSGGMISKFCSSILSACRSILDAFMSILITSDQWRKANSFQRQRTLANLVSRCSLAMELVVGVILMGDAIQSFWKFAFVGPTIAMGDNAAASGGGVGVGRLPFKCVLGKMACAHLYLNFLLSRRKKIAAVIGSIRGGGAMMNRVLDVLIDPKKEMGLSEDDEE